MPSELNAASRFESMEADDWQALASQYGTPFYLLDAELARRRIQEVKEAFGGLAGVYYAVKANPNLLLLKVLQSAADGVDISSGGEQIQALLAGFAASSVSFAGPAKTDVEIKAAVAAGVGCISVESLREIDACADAARQLGRTAQILIRVNPSNVHRAYGLKMGGKSSQFGIDEAELPQAEQRIQSHGAWLDCMGIHSYVGSQCFEIEAAVEATRNALRLADESSTRLGRTCRKVNLGGGFGVAQAGQPRELDVSGLATALRPALSEFRAAHPQAQIFFELGRYVVACAGMYVTSVIDVKVSRGTTYATCDGGLNHHLTAAGTFGALLRGNFPLRNLSRLHTVSEADSFCTFAGPSCNPTDLLGVQVPMAKPEIGDLLGIQMSGAYGLTASPMLFLGRDTPPELVCVGDRIELGRRRRCMAEFN